jgi:hypothetical protein
MKTMMGVAPEPEAESLEGVNFEQAELSRARRTGKTSKRVREFINTPK